MRASLERSRCQILPHLLGLAGIMAGLLFPPIAAWALPRSPFPPIPDTGVIYQQSFDGFHDISSGDARAFVPGVGLLVESWSGYALARSGTNVPAWIVPAVDPASGHTNLTCDASGAIRFYFEPFFSSASVSGGTGPGGTARLADLVASSPAGTAVVWSLQISADGTVVQSLGYGDSGPVQLLSAPIAWQARQYHLVALDYGPQGTALFIDGQLAAVGGGSVAIPASVGSLVLGSSIAGTDTAHGAFDEFFSFDHALTAGDIAYYYQFTGATAALGPISDEEALFAFAATTPMALPRVYDPNHDITCSPGGPVYITNVFATPQADGTMTFSFDIQGGTNGVFYDILSTTNLENTLDNSQWSWVGQGLTCNTYSFSNQPGGVAFYILEVPLQTTTLAWGRDDAGQSDVPLGLTTAEAVAAGGDFSLALLTNGTVIAWGTNTYGQTSIPPGLTNATAIAAGQYHGLALLTNGAVTNWGSFWDGFTNYPVTDYSGLAGPPTSNVMAIAAGAGHDLALLSNGTVVCWGLTNLYPTETSALAFETNLAGVRAIACGWNHNVALLSNGVVEAWGVNSTNAGWNLTNVPADLTNVVAIAAGGLHSVALRTNGTVEAWGVNDDGQTNVPAGLSNVVAVSAGDGWSLALQANGTLVFWGNTNLAAALLPTNMLGVKAISAGFQHNLAIASDGLPPLLTEPPIGFAPAGGSITFSVSGLRLANVQYQWQFNGTNITGATNATLTLTGVDSAVAGSYQAVISKGNGSATSLAASFGLAYPPQILSTSPSAGVTWIVTNTTLGASMNLTGESAYPLSYQWQFNGTNIAAATNCSYTIVNPVVTNEGNYTLIITNALGTNSAAWAVRLALPGMVESWGSDASGESDRPVALSNAASIAAGDYHSTAVTDSGTISQWGEYLDGALVSPPSRTNYVATAAGLDHDIGLLADGTVVTWGCSSAYANYVPTNLPPAQAVACGWYHNVALLTNGSVVAWGVNSYGLTNVPADLTNCTAIAASYTHSLALKADSTVEAWGYNGDGECNVPAGLSNVVAIAAGGGHCLALKSDGTVVAWGYNGSGQTNVPAGLSNVMAIAAGWEHSAVLKNDGTLVEWGDNSSGQATVPYPPPATYIPTPPYPGAPFPGFATTPPIVPKTIAAGGDHTMAAIFSPLVQYQVDVSKDLLLIYNTNSSANGSSNVCAYFLANRPMVANCTNVLAIGCTTNEIIDPPEYTNIIAAQIQTWLAANPTKRPQYVILFQDIPSRQSYNTGGGQTPEYPSVQYGIHTTCAMNWNPFVTSINMNGTGGTNDCIAYINKLAFMGSINPPGQLILSASAVGYGNSNWYFDDTETGYGGDPLGMAAEQGVIQAGVSSNAIVYTNVVPDCGSLACHITSATNIAGYLSWGAHSSLGTNYATNGLVNWTRNSGWYIIQIIESFNGERNGDNVTGSFLEWYASNAFGGINYSNTPVGAVSNVDEPLLPGVNYPNLYFGQWAAGRIHAYCAWNSFPNYTYELQVIGDPFIKG